MAVGSQKVAGDEPEKKVEETLGASSIQCRSVR